MASTSPIESASAELLACILEGEPWPDALLRRALVEDEGRSLFSVVVERLGDLFEPRLCDEYARLFTRVIELLRPGTKALDLLNRYERVRRVRRCEKRVVRNIYVLSRVTLGADVAVTSVIIDALRKRYPSAILHFVGSKKNWELFSADRRIQHMPFPYPRGGSLLERLSQWGHFAAPDSIVVDPDSRITQLGIIPVCDEQDYFFFESRSYGGDSDAPLPLLASQWSRDVFGATGRAFIATPQADMPCDAAVSFGVGENNEKRIPDSFEEQVLRALVDRGLTVIVDKGAGGEEARRINELTNRVPGLQTFEGPYSPFASMISQAKLYVGYDSAGQHVAAACGVPLVSVFAGYPSDRMFHRWTPYGPGVKQVIKVTDQTRDELVSETTAAIDVLLSR